MIDFEKELEAILQDDPLGLLAVKPKASGVSSADERLIASFEEINDFMRQHGHEPEKSRDISERKLYSRLKGLRENPEKAATLTEYDTFGLLPEIIIPETEEIKTIDDILESDILGLLDDNDEGLAGTDASKIFTLKHVPKSTPTKDFIAKRKRAQDFDKFAPLFKQVHAELAANKKAYRAFNTEKQIKAGEFFLLQGQLVYVANIGEWEERTSGYKDARLHLVYENGTESNLLLRSLASSLWGDENSRHVVDALQMEIFDRPAHVTKDDEGTGTIYILRSLSDDPQIRDIKNLYKIGFTALPVQQRIQNAKQDPTYLMANVALVTEFETYNLNLQKLEHLIHRFFAAVCLNVDVYDGEGRRYTPREWFVVPLPVIKTAVDLLINGDIVHYRYDSQQQAIVGK